MKKQKQTPYKPEDPDEKFLSVDPPPELIGAIAQSRWQATVQTLADERRRIPRSNEGVMIGYCAAFQLLADCETSLQTNGLLVDGGRDGQRRSPALAGKLQALTSIRNFADSLGLSPASANRMPIPPVVEEINPFAEFYQKPQ